MKRITLFLLLTVVLASCGKMLNHAPYLDFIYTTEYYTIKVKATAADQNDLVQNVIFYWGDGQSDTVNREDYSAFYLEHTYLLYGEYKIRAVAYDTYGDSTVVEKHIALADALENVRPGLYKSQDNEFLVLTLNMHTYQEKDQERKFNMIAEAIARLDIDFVLLQECAQNKYSSLVYDNIRADNMVLILKQKLKKLYGKDYFFVWDWAHYGWTIYEEGVAIMSKYPIIESESRWISSLRDRNEITSRKALYACFLTPWGKINVFSTHLHWKTYATDSEPVRQAQRLKAFAASKHDSINPQTTIVGGDFNVSAMSGYPWNEAYYEMTGDSLFKDSFLEIYPDANSSSQYFTVGGGYPGRIDYIFRWNTPVVTPVEAQIIFTGNVIGTVSDHAGVVVKFWSE